MRELVLLVGLLCVSSVVGDASLDWVVDTIVQGIQRDLKANNATRIPVSDFDKTISETFLGISFNAVLSAKGGTLGDASTLVRASPADIFQDGQEDQTTIMAQFGLENLQVSYDNFHAHVFGTTSEGRMTAVCHADAFTVSITAKEVSESKCVATVNYANVTSIGRCSVSLGPSGFTNWFRGYLYTYLLNHYSQDITSIVNQQITDTLVPYVQNNNLCKYLRPSKPQNIKMFLKGFSFN